MQLISATHFKKHFSLGVDQLPVAMRGPQQICQVSRISRETHAFCPQKIVDFPNKLSIYMYFMKKMRNIVALSWPRDSHQLQDYFHHLQPLQFQFLSFLSCGKMVRLRPA